MGLAFGYRGAPEATVAWGARLIVTQDGYVDFVHDRQDAIGPDRERRAFLDLLGQRYSLNKLTSDVSSGLSDRRIGTREEAEIELYDDEDVRVVGNTNASAGYFYVTAYAKASLASN